MGDKKVIFRIKFENINGTEGILNQNNDFISKETYIKGLEEYADKHPEVHLLHNKEENYHLCSFPVDIFPEFRGEELTGWSIGIRK
jgi:hypothetical protein